MDLDEARDFLRQHHRAVQHTHRSDGSPQLSPVVVGLDESGDALVSTREPSMKVANLERDPRTSLCVVTDGFFGPWLRIDGIAEIVRLPDAMEPLVALYRAIAGEHEDWDDYRRAMREERRVVLRIALVSAGPDVSG